nr:unnamed protein product [Naegleria fowleri]
MSLMIMSSVENATSTKLNKKNSSSGENSNKDNTNVVESTSMNKNAVLAKAIPTPTTSTTNVVEIGKAAIISPQLFADQFDIVLFTPEYIQQVAVALSVVFAQEEPLCIATKTNPINYFAYSLIYAQQCAANGNSMLAIDKNSRMVVGFHLCHDYDTWVEPPCNDPGVVQQGVLLERLHEIYHSQKHENVPADSCESQGSPRSFSPDTTKSGEKKKEKILKICSAGVFAFARRMKLATRMLEKNLEHAKQQGFTKVLVECTGAYSQSLYKSYGFNEVARIYYREYEVEVLVDNAKVKVKPFETIPHPHEFINLALRDL